jgi:cold shock CspA family protein
MSEPAVREVGTVQNWNSAKGYGFIETLLGERVFTHYTNVKGKGRRDLARGVAVEFTRLSDARGPRAVDVVVL